MMVEQRKHVVGLLSQVTTLSWLLGAAALMLILVCVALGLQVVARRRRAAEPHLTSCAEITMDEPTGAKEILE